MDKRLRQNAYNRKSYAKNREGRLTRAKFFHNRTKFDVFTHYSGGEPECACCGEKHIAFLSIDHINGGGMKHRREIGCGSGIRFYYWIKRNNFPEGLQVLCHNCNQGKWAHGICPHQELIIKT